MFDQIRKDSNNKFEQIEIDIVNSASSLFLDALSNSVPENAVVICNFNRCDSTNYVYIVIEYCRSTGTRTVNGHVKMRDITRGKQRRHIARHVHQY